MSFADPGANSVRTGPSAKAARLVVLLVAGLGLILTAWAYAPALEAEFYFDDETSILDNPAVHWTSFSWENVQGLLTRVKLKRRFAAHFSLALNHLAGGLDPFGYHLANVLIHLAVGAALFWLAVLYLRGDGTRSHRDHDIAAMAAIPVVLFLVHPLNTQAVTYVVQRMASLATLFSVLALAAYLMGRKSARKGTGAAWYIAALGFWVFALGSKENAAVLPLVVLTYEWCFHRGAWRHRLRSLVTESPARRTLAIVAPVLIVAFVGVGLATYVGGNPLHLFRDWPNRDFNGFERVLSQGRVHWLYLSLLIWPSPGRLNLDHDVAVSRALLVPPTTLFALVFWAAVLVLAVYLAARRPRYGFPLLAYFELHLVESGPVNLELTFEHRMYLPMTMLVLLGATALTSVPRGAMRTIQGSAMAVALLLALATHTRNQTWADPVALHQDVARKSPDKMRTHVNLGAALLNAGRAEEAFGAFQRALELSPNSYASHVGLGNAHLELDRPEEALREYREAARIAPDRFEAAYNIGLALKAQGRLDEATAYYSRVGTRLGMAGRAHEASRFLGKAVELNPESSENHNALGNAYLLGGSREEALREYQQAVALDSTNAEAVYNTGMALEQLGRENEAETYYRRFVAIAPPSLAPQAEQVRRRLGLPRQPPGTRP